MTLVHVRRFHESPGAFDDIAFAIVRRIVTRVVLLGLSAGRIVQHCRIEVVGPVGRCRRDASEVWRAFAA